MTWTEAFRKTLKGTVILAAIAVVGAVVAVTLYWLSTLPALIFFPIMGIAMFFCIAVIVKGNADQGNPLGD